MTTPETAVAGMLHSLGRYRDTVGRCAGSVLLAPDLFVELQRVVAMQEYEPQYDGDTRVIVDRSLPTLTWRIPVIDWPYPSGLNVP